jgi:hypothetical protein
MIWHQNVVTEPTSRRPKKNVAKAVERFRDILAEQAAIADRVYTS